MLIVILKNQKHFTLNIFLEYFLRILTKFEISSILIKKLKILENFRKLERQSKKNKKKQANRKRVVKGETEEIKGKSKR